MSISRREFIKYGALSAGALNLTLSGTAQAREQSESDFPVSIMKAELNDQDGSLEVIEGQMPDDVFGHAYMMEGLPYEKGHFTPSGKGAITRLDLNTETGTHFKRRMIRTPSAWVQEHVHKGVERFYLLGGMIYMSPALGFMNYCNTAPVWMGDNRLAITYEGGQPWEIDPLTLEIATPIGSPSEWTPSIPVTPKEWLFPQIRTTAHPYFDSRTGEMYTMHYGGFGRQSFVKLSHWDNYQGEFKHWKVVSRQNSKYKGRAAFIRGTAHCLGVTKNLVIIYDTSARAEPARMVGFTSVLAQKNKTPIWIVRKNDLKNGSDIVEADYLELPFDCSDCVSDYDDNNGTLINIIGQYLSATDKSEPIYRSDRLEFGGAKVDRNFTGYPIAPMDVGGLSKAVIRVGKQSADLIETDKVRDPELTWDLNDPAYNGHFEFPDSFENMYWSAVGYRPEHLVVRATKAYDDYPDKIFQTDDLPKESKPSAIINLNCKSMKIQDSYQFPSDAVMRSPQFLRRKGGSQSQTDGYILCPIVRKFPTDPERSNGREYWLFDAANLQQGPICKLSSKDLWFSTSNHMMWTDSIGPRPEGRYKADTEQYYRSRLPEHSKTVQNLFEKEILPRIL